MFCTKEEEKYCLHKCLKLINPSVFRLKIKLRSLSVFRLIISELLYSIAKILKVILMKMFLEILILDSIEKIN